MIAFLIIQKNKQFVITAYLEGDDDEPDRTVSEGIYGGENIKP